MSDRDVSVVLDVGMGSGISIGFTFVLWTFDTFMKSMMERSEREIQGAGCFHEIYENTCIHSMHKKCNNTH
jgi:hypothetical protein